MGSGLAEISDVGCGSNAECESMDMICDLNTFTCVQPSIVEEIGLQNLTSEECEFIINYQHSAIDKHSARIKRLERIILNYQIMLGVLMFVYTFGIIKRYKEKKKNE
jgi:hypothetical protein